MNLDERARRAAASIRQQAAQVDTDALLDRIQQPGGRRRWLLPAVATAAAAVVIVVVGLVLPQLQTDRIEIRPDHVVPGDPEPTPTETGTETSDGTRGVGTWHRVTNDAVFGGPGDQEMRAAATSGDVVVVVGIDREQAAVWRNEGDVDDPADWTRVGDDFCGEASCELTDVAADQDGFVAVGTLDGLPKVWRSGGGISWQRVDLAVPDGASEARLTAVTSDRGGFAALGSAFLGAGSRPFLVTSADGTDWQEQPVGFDAVEAGAFAIDAVTYRDAALALIQVGDGWSILEPQGDAWTMRDVGAEVSPDVALRAMTVVGEGLLLVGTQYLGAEEGEPVFWRSADGRDWRPVDNGLRIGSLEEPQAAVAAGSTVMAFGETRDPAGGAPPHPVFWLEMEDGFQALDGGPALHDPGRMIAATSLADGRIVVVGEGSEGEDVGEDGDAAVWTFRRTEGSGQQPSTDETDAADGCSAVVAPDQPAPQPDLPDPVADTRQASHEAAASCDLDTLGSMVMDLEHGFTYSYGDADD